MQILILILILFSCAVFLNYNLKNATILDFFLASLLFFFVAYPLSDLLRGNLNIDNSIFLIIYIYIFLTYITLHFLILKKKVKFISLKTIILQAQKISSKTLFYLFSINIITVLYFFIRYKLIFRVLSDASIVNTYRMAIYTFVIPCFYLLLLISFIKLQKNIKKSKFILVFYSVSTVLYFLLFGRREFILAILLIIFVWGHINKKNFFSLINIVRLGLTGIVIIIASNFYQNVRRDIMAYSITGEIVKDKSIGEMLFDFESSDENLDARGSLLNLTNELIAKIENGYKPLNGEVFLQSIEKSIPSALYPNKKVVNIDDTIAANFNISATDFGASKLIAFYIDFGFFALIIYPLFNLLIWLIFIFVLEKVISNPLLYLSIIIIFLINVFNLESSIEVDFLAIRTVLICIIVFKSIAFLKKLKLMNYAS